MTLGTEPTRLLCPWDFPGKSTGVGCHFLLQGIFSTQGSNLRLLHCQADSLPMSHLGSPKNKDSLLHNHNTVIRFRKFKLDVILFFNPQFMFKFYELFINVFFFFFLLPPLLLAVFVLGCRVGIVSFNLEHFLNL